MSTPDLQRVSEEASLEPERNVSITCATNEAAVRIQGSTRSWSMRPTSSSSASSFSPDASLLSSSCSKGKGRLDSAESPGSLLLASPPTSYSGSSFFLSPRNDKGKEREQEPDSATTPRPSSRNAVVPAQVINSEPAPLFLHQTRSRSHSMPLAPSPSLRPPRAPFTRRNNHPLLASSSNMSRGSSPLASGASTPNSASRQSLTEPDTDDGRGRSKFSRSLSNMSLSLLSRTRRDDSSSAHLARPVENDAEDRVKAWKKTKKRISRIVKSTNSSRRNSLLSSSSPFASPPITPGTASPLEPASRNSSALHLAMDTRPARPKSTSRARAISTPVIVTSPIVPVDSVETSDAAPPTTRPASSLSRPPRSKYPLDLFDFLLPRELRVRILGMLVECCVDDWHKEVQSGAWRGEASRDRWIGELRGRRELVRCGRVSRSWLSLSLDGQLWSHYPGTAFGSDILSTPHLLRIFNASGSFVKSLDLAGMHRLNGPTLATMVDLVTCDRRSLPLTSLNLTGCTGISSAALAYMLRYCPHLTKVTLRGLESVDGRVLDALTSTASALVHLDTSYCPRLPVRLLKDLPTTVQTLKIAAVRGLTDEGLVEIACHFTQLTTLDVSMCRHLTDDAFLSIVQQTCNVPRVELNHSERRVAGRESDLAVKRKLAWRHVNLTGCRGLTDRALSHLAYATPALEFIELARIGTALQPEGLKHFFESVPKIRRVDLEDASAITDAVLLALTPSADPASPGSNLETLIISGCVNLTDAAIRTFIERSPVTRLEADSTTVSEATAKVFVQSMRSRKERGAVLSLLDGLIGRRLAKSLALATRPRTGLRGFESRHFDYHDEADARTLHECNESLVVLRSFHGHMLLDLANETRREKRDQLDRSKQGGASRKRAQAIRDFTSGRVDDDTSAFCTIS